jgi:uncharacterized membrane protein YbhN (UPF0104 family)
VSTYVAIERCGARRRRWSWAAARFAVAAALLVVVALRVGGSAFARGIDALTAPVVIAAFALTALSSCCAAWRWLVVARELGARLPAGRAVAAYYRSQFLNSVLPGGVVGDAHRAVAHGRDVDDVGLAARAVLWERSAGQLVQAVISIAVLVIAPSPGRQLAPLLAGIVGAVLLVAWHVWRARGRGSSWPARVLTVAQSDLRQVLTRPAWPVVVVASCGVVVSHVALFVMVAHSVDPAASVTALLPLAVIVQLATGIPLSVAGWGLREGAAAWVFAAAGLGAATGVAASAAYGVASLIALLPGAVVLATDSVHRAPRPRPTPSASPVGREVGLHG